MSFSTYYVKSACFANLFCLFLYLGVVLLSEISVLAAGFEYLLVLSFGEAGSFYYYLLGVIELSQLFGSEVLSVAAEQYISTAARHVGGYGNCAVLTRLRYYLSFLFMILRVEHLVLYALVFQQAREVL